jgi:uncharacterized repeat protein (TIGR03803 family)
MKRNSSSVSLSLQEQKSGRGKDGKGPTGVLIEDVKGNLYGTTGGGGRYGAGTVFRISPTGRETVMHHFTGADGAVPAAGLIQDALGNLFGTTATGGAYGHGAVFKLAADGTETVLYSFCGDPDCVDGNQPSFASLVRDRAGNMYGVAGLGADQAGVVFKLTP